MHQGNFRKSTLAKREKIIEQVRDFFSKEKKYVTMQNVCKALGYPRSTLTSLKLHTDEIALEFGLERTGKKPKGSIEEKMEVSKKYEHLYRQLIIERQRPVTLAQFAVHLNKTCSTLFIDINGT